MNIFITGITGLIGGSLARCLATHGHTITGSSRKAGSATGAGAPSMALDLDQRGLLPGMLAGIDMVVHCAFDAGPHAEERNLDGTVAIARAARVAGIPGQILLSSYSAWEDSPSGYGRLKAQLETRLAGPDICIVRPGLVAGPGGIFARMTAMVAAHRCLPVPDGGRHRVPVIGIGGLSEAIARLIGDGTRGDWNLFHDEQPTLAEILQEIARARGLRRHLVPVPIGLATCATQLAAHLGIRLPIDSDSMRAYRFNAGRSRASDLHRLGIPAPSLRELAEQAQSPAGCQ